MKLLAFIPIKLTLLLILGIILGEALGLKPFTCLLLTAFSLIALGVIFLKSGYKYQELFGSLVVCLMISIGMLAISLATPENLDQHYSHNRPAAVPTWHLKIKEILKPTPYSRRYVAKIQAVNETIASGKILVELRRDSSSHQFYVDDEIAVCSRPQPIEPPKNPYEFNYRAYMNRLGITHTMQIKEYDYFVKKEFRRTVYGVAANLRNTISNDLNLAGFEKDELSIIQALLLGQRQDIGKSTYNNYKAAGAVHMLAVSGLHIGILLLILQFLLKPLEYLPRGKTVKMVVIVALLWCFAFLAGLSASVVRAVSMFSFVAYALYLNRPGNSFNIMALSMFFILLLNDPMLLFQVGFQMSYAAVLSIVWIYPKLQRFWYPRNFFLRKIWQLISVSVAAQLGVFPISLFYFHQFPGLFLLSNLVIIPFLGIILGLGIGVIIFAQLGVLSDTVVTFYSSTIKLMNEIVGWVASHETFVFKDIHFDVIQLFLSYFLLIALVAFLDRRNFKSLAIFLIGVLGYFGWLISVEFKTLHKESVLVLHQNAGTIIFHRNGKSLVVHASDSLRSLSLASNFSVAERVSEVVHRPIKNAYKMVRQNVFIVDSTAILPPHLDVDVLLLTQSPKINLERYLEENTPEVIIADGSNYFSYVARWATTCKKKKLPFHYTREKGAYYFDISDN